MSDKLIVFGSFVIILGIMTIMFIMVVVLGGRRAVEETEEIIDEIKG